MELDNDLLQKDTRKNEGVKNEVVTNEGVETETDSDSVPYADSLYEGDNSNDYGNPPVPPPGGIPPEQRGYRLQNSFHIY